MNFNNNTPPAPMGAPAPMGSPSQGGPISLSKGQKISLSKVAPALKKVVVGLGWDINAYASGGDYDLDASCFLCNDAGICANPEQNFIFYNNLKHASGCIEHTGDNRTGAGDGDDEQIKIDLTKVPAEISKIAFTVTIDQADVRKQTFGQVENAFIRLVNEEDGKEVIRYDLGEDFSVETAIVVGELYRNNGEWKFSAVGAGFANGLAGLCKKYGVETC